MATLKSIPTGRKGKGGPNTGEGKQASSRNSTRHGLYARTLDAFAPADRADFETLHREYAAHFRPGNLVEQELVHQLAFNRFRYHRFVRFQEAAFCNLSDDRAALGEIDTHTRTHEYFERALIHLDRAYQRTLRLLDQRQKQSRESECEVIQLGVDLVDRRIECTSDPGLERLFEIAETNSDRPHDAGPDFIVIRALKPKSPGGWRDHPQAA